MGSSSSKDGKRARVVVLGLGDAGLLVATNLSERCDVTAVTTKQCQFSAQEMGLRLTRPDKWKEYFMLDFDRYRAMDNVRIVHGAATGVDTKRSCVEVALADGGVSELPYDVLVIATGKSGGFWRDADVVSHDESTRRVTDMSSQLSSARKIAVIGGGVTGVSIACNAALHLKGKEVHHFYSRQHPLPQYHVKVQRRMAEYGTSIGVTQHPEKRAVIPADVTGDVITTGAVQFEDGSTFSADAVVWATGRHKPNSEFLPRSMVDEKGYVVTDEHLRCVGHANIYAIGDVAQAPNDPGRSSVRNFGHTIVAANVLAGLEGKAPPKKYKPEPTSWGSVIGPQNNGMWVFLANGRSVTIPKFIMDKLQKVSINKMYGGVRWHADKKQ